MMVLAMIGRKDQKILPVEMSVTLPLRLVASNNRCRSHMRGPNTEATQLLLLPIKMVPSISGKNGDGLHGLYFGVY